jgi:hypothetical protein
MGIVFPVQAMKAYRGRRGIAPRILILGTRYLLNSGPDLFTAGKKPPLYPLGPSTGVDVSKKRKIYFLCQDSNHGPSTL